MIHSGQCTDPARLYWGVVFKTVETLAELDMPQWLSGYSSSKYSGMQDNLCLLPLSCHLFLQLHFLLKRQISQVGFLVHITLAKSRSA